MVELTYNNVQTIPSGQAAVFNTVIACPCRHVLHANESSVITMMGTPNTRDACFATYDLDFKANIALSEGATVGPIAVTISNEGEALQIAQAIVTPAAVGDYFNVSCTAVINVPKGCCAHVGVENISVGTTTNPSIDMQNAVLKINQTR